MLSILRPTAYVEGEFVALVAFSIFIAALIYRAMWSRRAISRSRALIFGLTLIILAGVDVFLLRVLTSLARFSPSVFNDVVFDSELTVALYLLPTLFGGTGINVVSHLVIQPLVVDRIAIRTPTPDWVSRRVEEPTKAAARSTTADCGPL